MADPMTPAQWREALRAEGAPFTELEGWTSRGRDQATGKVFGPVNGVLNHHTAGRDSLALIAYWGQGAAVPAPLAHALLPKDGRLVLIADGRANHAGLAAKNSFDAIVAEKPIPRPSKASGTVDGNDRLYGLEVENLGNGTDAYSCAQYDTWVRFNAALCRHHDWGAGSCAGHLETSVEGKPDPRGPVEGYGRRGRFTFTMGQLRADVNERLAHAPSWNPPTAEETDMPDYLNLGLARGYRLAPGSWDDVEFTTEWTDEADGHPAGSANFVTGPAGFTGSLALRLERLPVGEVVQVRMTEYDAAGTLKHNHPPHEVIGTRGGTYSHVPLTKRIGPGRVMRVRVLNQAGEDVEVASAVLTAWVWAG
ncbi:peptidoglycan recognition protein family protein [Streptomyces salinarius]|uniref:peptidoglycan recognition protein family protein n=1 Tax=Streptomyces salinarius TaxID=2762598 RepID=UPI002852AD4E|nr:N-acetylmuramoyl-L-alanine amidase [Streptomyces salinarius]